MRTHLTKVLRLGLQQPGFYKSTYRTAHAMMRDYGRRLDQLEWACKRLKRHNLELGERGRILLILQELKQLKQENPQ